MGSVLRQIRAHTIAHNNAEGTKHINTYIKALTPQICTRLLDHILPPSFSLQFNPLRIVSPRFALLKGVLHTTLNEEKHGARIMRIN